MKTFIAAMNENMSGYGSQIKNTPMGPFRWNDLTQLWENVNNGMVMNNVSFQDMFMMDYNTSSGDNGTEKIPNIFGSILFSLGTARQGQTPSLDNSLPVVPNNLNAFNNAVTERLMNGTIPGGRMLWKPSIFNQYDKAQIITKVIYNTIPAQNYRPALLRKAYGYMNVSGAEMTSPTLTSGSFNRPYNGQTFTWGQILSSNNATPNKPTYFTVGLEMPTSGYTLGCSGYIYFYEDPSGITIGSIFFSYPPGDTAGPPPIQELWGNLSNMTDLDSSVSNEWFSSTIGKALLENANFVAFYEPEFSISRTVEYNNPTGITFTSINARKIFESGDETSILGAMGLTIGFGDSVAFSARIGVTGWTSGNSGYIWIRDTTNGITLQGIPFNVSAFIPEPPE